MSVHAMEEMAEDNLDILDVEQAVLTGQIVRTEKVIREERSTLLKDLLLMA